MQASKKSGLTIKQLRDIESGYHGFGIKFIHEFAGNSIIKGLEETIKINYQKIFNKFECVYDEYLTQLAKKHTFDKKEYALQPTDQTQITLKSNKSEKNLKKSKKIQDKNLLEATTEQQTVVNDTIIEDEASFIECAEKNKKILKAKGKKTKKKLKQKESTNTNENDIKSTVMDTNDHSINSDITDIANETIEKHKIKPNGGRSSSFSKLVHTNKKVIEKKNKTGKIIGHKGSVTSLASPKRVTSTRRSSQAHANLIKKLKNKTKILKEQASKAEETNLGMNIDLRTEKDECDRAIIKLTNTKHLIADTNDSLMSIKPSQIISSTQNNTILKVIPPQIEVSKTPFKPINHESKLNTIQKKLLTNTVKKPDEYNHNLAKSIHASGKVKQMVEMCEARLKIVNTPSVSAAKPVKEPTQSKLKPPNGFDKVNSHTIKANKIRSSIDKRKLRVSSTKPEAKRQSIKRVNAFLKDINDANSSTVTISAIASTTITIETNQSIAKKQLKFDNPNSAHPVVHAVHAPAPTPSVSGSNAKRLPNPKELIASSSTVQQHYRLVGNAAASKLPPTSQRKNSFTKFLERNTPLKMTKAELEEKRKIELQFKEKKEQERLHEREKQVHEKIELAKKKREEKMKKIVESKAKQHEVDQKRKEEINAKLKEVEENKKRIIEEKLEKQKQKTASATNIVTSSAAPNTGTPLSTNKLNVKQPQHLKKPVSPNNNAKPLPTIKIEPYEEPPSKCEALREMNTNIQNATPQIFIKQESKDIEDEKENEDDRYDNYGIDDLESSDATDDEEEPSKPIPEWASNRNLMPKAINQNYNLINFTKIFRSACQHEIILENIFKIKRKKFTERSSSAIWSSPPVWNSGINGNESFRQIRK